MINLLSHWAPSAVVLVIADLLFCLTAFLPGAVCGWEAPQPILGPEVGCQLTSFQGLWSK
jgi:hypothetical protein